MSVEIISEKKTKIGQVVVTFTVGRIVSQAKASEGNGATGRGEHSEATDSMTGEASRSVDGRTLTATSEHMDVTAGETAPNSPAVADTRPPDSGQSTPPAVFADPTIPPQHNQERG